jgi:solute carrier family 25 protein 16
MYTHEGMLGLFKGNGATILKIAPFSAAEFYYYEVYKNMFFPGKTRNELKFWEKLIAGGVTGMTAQTITYPLDLLKTYLTINIENNTRISMWE